MKKLGLLMLAITLMLGATAFAQTPNFSPDNSVYFTNYFSGNRIVGAPDATLRIINDGDDSVNYRGTLYASIYVFDDSQELTECCSCPISYDGLLSESVTWNLTASPITGLKPSRGVIKVISSETESDINTGFAPNKPVPGLRVWGTHIQGTKVAYVPYDPNVRKVPVVSGPWFVTETKAADSNLTKGEETLLEELCLFDNLLSGYPCTCQPEDYDF